VAFLTLIWLLGGMTPIVEEKRRRTWASARSAGSPTTASRVRRAKAALSSGCKPHPVSRGLPDCEMLCSRLADPLPRRRRKAGISGDLSAVIEVSGESLGPEDRSELRPNAMDTQQHRRRGRHFCFCVEQRVPLGLCSLDLLEQQFEPIEFSTNLGFEMSGQATAIPSLERIQSRTPVATQRLIPGCAPREEQASNPVGDLTEIDAAKHATARLSED